MMCITENQPNVMSAYCSYFYPYGLTSATILRSASVTRQAISIILSVSTSRPVIYNVSLGSQQQFKGIRFQSQFLTFVENLLFIQK